MGATRVVAWGDKVKGKLPFRKLGDGEAFL